MLTGFSFNTYRCLSTFLLLVLFQTQSLQSFLNLCLCMFCIILLFLLLKFPFIPGSEQFDYNFFSCNFHYISCVWSLLRFWAVDLYFSPDLETFQPLLFKNIFFPFPFKDSSSSCTSPLKIFL